MNTESLATLRYKLKQLLADPKAMDHLSQEEIDQINFIMESTNEQTA